MQIFRTKFTLIGGRGLYLELSDKVILTTAFTACKTNRPVIGCFHRVSPKQVFKKHCETLCSIEKQIPQYYRHFNISLQQIPQN